MLPLATSLFPSLSFSLLFALLAAAPPVLAGGAWQEIAPGGATRCGPGQPFRFFARPGDPDLAVLFLQGGGGCWSSQTCRLSDSPTYDPSADREDLDENLAGLLDLDRPDNPIRRATVVFVPYCTGDAHLGAATRRYRWLSEDGRVDAFETHHAGHANVLSAIDWLARAAPAPAVGFVTGESAGGVAAGFYAGVLADRYPGARIVHLADSSAGLRARAISDILDTWGATAFLRERPGYASEPQLDFESFYAVEAARHPGIRWAQLNRVDDAVLAFFSGLAGRNGSGTRALIAEARERVRRTGLALQTYDLAGTEHTILSSEVFYTASADGVRLRDWVDGLLSGAPPRAVRCTGCALVP